MKVSYKWLQTYFDDELPSPEDLGNVLTFHAFEIEGIDKVNDDHVIDIDVLPNRSSDCLSHRGIAKEISVLLDKKLKSDPLKTELTKFKDTNVLDVEVQDFKLCRRYSVLVIKGVKVGPSPKWLVDYLEVIGQKSINNVVDATNCVMLNIGQPLHAFDMDKLSGDKKKIVVRSAKNGEKITTLTGEEYKLDESNLLITDGSSDIAIGIAGVKGGIVAEIDNSTKDIILEAASFNFVSIRKTAQKLKLWTDASIRFQNQPSPELVPYALRDVAELIKEIAGGEIEGSIEKYSEDKKQSEVSVSLKEINNLLGSSVSQKEVEDILTRFEFDYKINDEVFTVTSPFERTDISIKEDLIEEVGRVYGYENISSQPITPGVTNPKVNKEFYYKNKVSSILLENGFDEIYTYSFQKKGEVEMENPLGQDTKFLRSNLGDAVKEKLVSNSLNAPLFGLDSNTIGLFETGVVFLKDKEYKSLVIAYSGKEKRLNEIKETLSTELDVEIKENIKDKVLEINFTELVEKLPEVDKYDSFEKKEIIKYKSIIPYPFVLRDIALWVPESVTPDKILKLMDDDLLIVKNQFDEYKKDGKISYAFHLVFQSNEGTLSDVEVGKIMDKITSNLSSNEGWEIR